MSGYRTRMLMALAPPKPNAIVPLLRGDRSSLAERLARGALLIAWLVVAAWLAHAHVLWRDEVRALSLALTGDTSIAMLRRIHGEGHPALWYLLLRGAWSVAGVREVLPGVAFAIGAAAAALFVWRAPFRAPVIAVTLFGAFFVDEYTASARNYGIAMLLLFAFAAFYPRWRTRGVGLGIILALLCNTNLPAVMLAGALSLFWFVELLCDPAPRWPHFALNMGLALVGVAACVAEVYPPYNDAALSPTAGHQTLGGVLLAVGNIAQPFSALLPEAWWGAPLISLLLAVAVLGAALGLVRSPGGLLAGLAVAVAMPVFFQIIYAGGYRHQALFLTFMLTLYWLVADGGGGRWRGRAVVRPAMAAGLQRIGQAGLLALLLAQVAITAGVVRTTASGAVASRAAQAGALLRRHGLGRAVVIADFDTMTESLPYYAPNPIWQVREHRWAQVAAFTKAAERDVTMRALLATARALHARTRRPVVILIATPIDPAVPAQAWRQGYVGTFSTTAADTRAFLAASRPLARFGPAATDESYTIYLLR